MNTEQSVSFSCFSFSGNVELKITGKEPITSFTILPTSAGIEGNLAENTISFSLDNPQKLAIVINGDYLNPLFLFANAMEVGKPDKSDFGTLVIHEGDDYC